MVNRNPGSGTRILIDRLLAGRQPPGYWAQAKSHNAVAVRGGAGPRRLGRGDRAGRPRLRPGLPAAAARALRLPGADARLDRPPAVRFIDLLADLAVGSELADMGFSV